MLAVPPAHRNPGEIKKAIFEYLDVHNENPKPFIWTNSADQIIESSRPSRMFDREGGPLTDRVCPAMATTHGANTP